ncbi:hypothetical protein HOK021_26690 [Streptomyces hygroscopicus]|nr:hypothetical protein HOK021_26690 [Streptomyces hygroscopicus]
MTFADKAYQGAGGAVRTPFKRHRHRPKLSARQKAVNKAHARIRARYERAVATLKTWKLLTKLRCSPSRTTTIVQAILALHHVENPDLPRLKNPQWMASLEALAGRGHPGDFSGTFNPVPGTFRGLSAG